MKKIFTLALTSVAITIFAQSNFSFETSEGYTLGSIHNQNGWEVTLNSDDDPIQNQDVANDFASDGTNALKISVDENEGFGFFPVFGATKSLETPYNYDGFTMEFDVYFTELDGSTNELGAWGIDGDEFVPIFYYSFNYTGNLEIVSSVDYDYEDADFTWEPNKWYHLKTEITENEIKYYIDGVLIYTGDNFAKLNIEGIQFVHDNFGGSAYIDNIKLYMSDLATTDTKKVASLQVFPNPSSNFFTIASDDNIVGYTIYNQSGQLVISGSNAKHIDIQNLLPGVYIVSAKTVSGKIISTKLIKK